MKLDCPGHVSALPRGALNGADDAHIGPAAADVAVHVFDDLLPRGVGVAFEKSCRLHDLPGLAVAALRYLLGNPRLLKRMAGVRGQTFNGCHRPSGYILKPGNAGACRRAIDMNRAGPALRDAATELGAGELQMLP